MAPKVCTELPVRHIVALLAFTLANHNLQIATDVTRMCVRQQLVAFVLLEICQDSRPLSDRLPIVPITTAGIAVDKHGSNMRQTPLMPKP
jgi:hypothetical protein